MNARCYDLHFAASHSHGVQAGALHTALLHPALSHRVLLPIILTHSCEETDENTEDQVLRVPDQQVHSK